jgi:hypothetical protein
LSPPTKNTLNPLKKKKNKPILKNNTLGTGIPSRKLPFRRNFMLTKGAFGNLANRYRAVLKKCNLINTFGSLAVASMLLTYLVIMFMDPEALL